MRFQRSVVSGHRVMPILLEPVVVAPFDKLRITVTQITVIRRDDRLYADASILYGNALY